MSREDLEQGVRTIVDGVSQLVKVVKQSTAATTSAELTQSARPLIQGLKDLVSKVLAPGGQWKAPNLESTAQALKANILSLVKCARAAFSSKEASALDKLDQQARTTIYSAKQILRVWQSSVNGSSEPAGATGEAPSGRRRRRGRDGVYSIKMTGDQTQQNHQQQGEEWEKKKKQMEARDANRRSQAFTGGSNVSIKQNPMDSPKTAIKKREALIRQSRKSISLARQSVHQLFGANRSNRGNDQNNLLLQKVLQQISTMEQQMQRMEQDLDRHKRNPQAASVSVDSQSEASMMDMMAKLQEQMKAAEAARLAQLEAEFKQREAAMAEKEKRLELLLSGLDMEALEAKLQKVKELEENMDMDKINKKLSKIDQIEARIAAGDFGGGPIRAYDELKETVAELQKKIFDDNTSDKERAAANIELEKALKDLEKCPEFIAEKREQMEKWKKENAPLNAAAYNEVIGRLRQEAQSNRERFRKKMEKCAELQLLLLKKEAILKKHSSDFTSYVLNVSQQELRALFHHMPKFRSNQTIQLQFVQTLENKIRENEKRKVNKPEKPKVKRTGKKFVVKKSAGGGGGMSFLDELKKKRQKIN